MSTVAVGLVTRNRREALLRAIESAVRQSPPPAQVLVVDNASTDGTAQAVRQRYPQAQVIRLPRNLGCPASRNVLYVNCACDYIVNLDDDGWLGEGAVGRVAESFDADPTAGILVFSQRYPDEDGGFRPGEPGAELGIFPGGVSAFRLAMLEKTGLFPDDFFLSAENFLSLRALDAGYRIVAEPRAVMWHPHVGGSDTGEFDYHKWRNSMLTVTRLFPGWLMVRHLAKRMLSAAKRSRRRGSFGQFLRAVGHVLWHLPATLRRRKPCRRQTVEKYLRLIGR